MHHFNEITDLVMSSVDVDRIRAAVAAGLQASSITLLRDEIIQAEVVPQPEIPPDVVTMNSRVKIRDSATGQTRELTLVAQYS